MTRIHFLSFGDGSCDLRASLKRICQEAAKENLFASINGYTFLRLRKEFPDFWKQYGPFILGNKRGAGYWIWKPFLILEQLKRIGEDEVVLYADAGCEFRQGRGLQIADIVERRFDVAVCELNTNDGRGWDNYNIETWSNKFTLERTSCPDAFLSLPQFATTLIFIRNTRASNSLMFNWWRFATADHGACSIDREFEDESQAFIEHRHDQSIFSILTRISNSEERLNVNVIDGSLLESDTGFFVYAARNKTGIAGGVKRMRSTALKYRLQRKIHYFFGFEKLYRSMMR